LTADAAISPSPQGTALATAGGLIALALWASTIAVVGSLASSLGVWTATATTYALASALGWSLGGDRARRWRRLPPRHRWGCGALFALYMTLLTAAIGGAASQPSALVAVSMLNYLWPALTVALSVPLLGYRASPWLWPSLLIGSGGAWLAIAGDDLSASLAPLAASAPWGAWLCAAAAAAAWAAYSNLTRKLAQGHDEDPTPAFMGASAIALAIAAPLCGDSLTALARATPSTWAALLYMAALPGWLAYALWDRAMRAGNHALVAAASYATPVLSALLIAAVHGLSLSWSMIAAAGLVLCGGVGSRLSVSAPPQPPHAST
jgi:drug/metabolite transporter (DMT)-like permease